MYQTLQRKSASVCSLSLYFRRAIYSQLGPKFSRIQPLYFVLLHSLCSSARLLLQLPPEKNASAKTHAIRQVAQAKACHAQLASTETIETLALNQRIAIQAIRLYLTHITHKLTLV